MFWPLLRRAGLLVDWSQTCLNFTCVIPLPRIQIPLLKIKTLWLRCDSFSIHRMSESFIVMVAQQSVCNVLTQVAVFHIKEPVSVFLLSHNRWILSKPVACVCRTLAPFREAFAHSLCIDLLVCRLRCLQAPTARPSVEIHGE